MALIFCAAGYVDFMVDYSEQIQQGTPDVRQSGSGNSQRKLVEEVLQSNVSVFEIEEKSD